MTDFHDEQSQLSGTVHGSGAGATLLLLHSLAMNRGMWTPSILELFGRGRQLIVCDLPGHGESPLGETRSIEAMADRVALMLNGLGIASAVVAGASMGGCVAQALALGHPERVLGLGLVDTTSGYGDPDAWAARAATARREGFAAMADFQGSRWFTAAFREQHPEELERLLGIFVSMDLDDYELVCHAMGAVDLTARLPGISCPAAVVVGIDDYATPVAHAERLAAGIDGATLTVIDGASHLGILEKPEEIFRAIEHVL